MTMQHPTPYGHNPLPPLQGVTTYAAGSADPYGGPAAPPPHYPQQYAPPASPAIISNHQVAYRPFVFDGGAGTYVGTAILAALLTVFTFGLGTPWAICMIYRWRTQHTIVNGYPLRFTGTGGGLFGSWVKWWLLIIITLGIYSFWVIPRLTKWTVEHQEFTSGG